MEAVVELAEWAEVLERNPANRERFLAQDPAEFIETMGRWMAVYCPGEAEVVPGMSMEEARAFDLPTLVFRSGAYDIHHTRRPRSASWTPCRTPGSWNRRGATANGPNGRRSGSRAPRTGCSSAGRCSSPRSRMGGRRARQVMMLRP